MMNSYVYRKGKALEKNVSRSDLAHALWDKEARVWVDLEAPSEFEIETLIELFNFHPLAIEDCITDISQPKVDDYTEYLFIVVHAIQFKSKEEVSTVELDIFLGKNYVVTVHNQPLKSISQARESAVKKGAAFFTSGTEMVVHGILDQLVDNFLPVLNSIDEKIDQIEEALFTSTSSAFLDSILKLQKDVWFLRRIISPQRDTINHLSRVTTPFIHPKNLIYFRDIYDHVFQICQSIEGFHEILTGVLQVHFSHASQKLNEVMKTLTVLATIALPSVVISSLYGMNFEHMPELRWEWGYYYALGLMTLSSAITVIFMKWKKWF